MSLPARRRALMLVNPKARRGTESQWWAISSR